LGITENECTLQTDPVGESRKYEPDRYIEEKLNLHEKQKVELK